MKMSLQISIKRPITSHSQSQYMQLSNIIRQIKEAVAHRVSHRLKVTEAVQIATLLDPSTKDLMCSVPFHEQKKLLVSHTKLHARNYLSVSASSVPIEAMFSTCVLMLNQKRSSMTPYRANLLSVVHDNYGKFFPVNQHS